MNDTTNEPTASDVAALLKRLTERLTSSPPREEVGPETDLKSTAPGVGPLAQLERGSGEPSAPVLQDRGLHVPGLDVCRADEYLIRRIAYCPNCRTKRRFVGQHAVWYGTRWTCCGCADSWDESGFRCPRWSQRGWRTGAIAEAKKLWDAAGPYDPKAFAAWCEDQFGFNEQKEGEQ